MPLGTAKCQLKEVLPANMKCLAGELEVLQCLYPEDLVFFFLAGRFACGVGFMLPSVGFVGSLVETLWPMEVGKKNQNVSKQYAMDVFVFLFLLTSRHWSFDMSHQIRGQVSFPF